MLSLTAPNGSDLRVSASEDAHSNTGFWALTLGSIGVVYGDIGTSPLYAFREAIVAAHRRREVTRAAVLRRALADLLGADRHRHAEIRAAPAARRQQRRGRHAHPDGAGAARTRPEHADPRVLLGIIAGALFYGDAVITPALSVLSAVEGLKIATPAFDPYVVPLTVVILVALFAVQSRGTAQVAAFFGPVTLVWFVAIAMRGSSTSRRTVGAARAQSVVRACSFLGATARSASSHSARCFSR